MFTNQVGLGNTLTTVGVIGESFGITSQGQLSWLIAGYSLTIGTFILIGGRLGDEFGNKKMFVIGMAWYSLWSMVAGLSVYSSHVLFIFARIFQGMGPAMTLPNGLGILGKSYSPGPRLNMSFAWFGGSAPFGAIAGFLLEAFLLWLGGHGSTGAKRLRLRVWQSLLHGQFLLKQCSHGSKDDHDAKSSRIWIFPGCSPASPPWSWSTLHGTRLLL